MRRRHLSFLFALLVVAVFLLQSSTVPAGVAAGYAWSDTRGPGDAGTRALAFDESRGVLYRGTVSRGVWKYQDGGWSFLEGGPRNCYITSVVCDSNRNMLYAGTRSHGVWRCSSPDSAPDWTEVTAGLTPSWIEALAYDEVRNVLFAGTVFSDGVWRCDTPDTSPAWTDLTWPEPYVRTLSLTCDSANNALYAGTMGSGVWRCDGPDGSPSWVDTAGALGATWVHSLAYDSGHNVLYAGIDGYTGGVSDGVWRCDEPGSAPAWTDTGGGPSNRNVHSLSCDEEGDVLYAGTEDSLWRCDDPRSGPTWVHLAGPLDGEYLHAIARDTARNIIYAGSDSIIKCEQPDSDPSFTDTGVASSEAWIDAFAYDSSRDILYAATTRGAWRCDSACTAPAWTEISGTMGNISVSGVAYDPARNVLYAGFNLGTAGGGVKRCDNPDSAPSWTSIGMSSYFAGPMAYDATYNVLYSSMFYPGHGGYALSGVWRCDNPDTSPSWADTGGAFSPSVINALAYDRARNLLYAGTSLSGVWRCSNPESSPSWSSTGGGLGGSYVSGLVHDGARNIVYATTFNGAWRCAAPDASPSWEDISGAMAGCEVHCLAFDAAHNVLLAGTRLQGVLRRGDPDGLSDWVEAGSGLDSWPVGALAIPDGRGVLYAGMQGAGAWYSLTPGITACAPISAVPGRTLDVSIEGNATGFEDGVSAAVFSGVGITVNSTEVSDPTHAVANITVAPDAPPGPRDVNVTTAGFVPDALAGGFTVDTPPPSIAPDTVPRDALYLDVEINGSGLQPGATVRLERPGYAISAYNVQVVSDTRITCTFGFWGAPEGTYDLVITNPDGVGCRLESGFEVEPFDPCGTGGGMSGMLFGLTLGLLSLAGSGRLRRRRGKGRALLGDSRE